MNCMKFNLLNSTLLKDNLWKHTFMTNVDISVPLETFLKFLAQHDNLGFKFNEPDSSKKEFEKIEYHINDNLWCITIYCNKIFDKTSY